jgi:glucose-6-phosphate 1-epimerase
MPLSRSQWQSSPLSNAQPPANQTSTDNRLWVIETDDFIAEVASFGGQLLRFYSKSQQREILFVSPNADFSGNAPIRAGIPLCWPWFSDMSPPSQYTGLGKPPSHGFARTSTWLVEHSHAENGTASIEFSLPPEIIKMNFNTDLSLTIRYTLTASKIKIDLLTKNHGAPEFQFTQALHSYFAVDDIQNIELTGLAHDYLDKTRGFNRFGGENVLRVLQEVDRVYLTDAPVTWLREGERKLSIQHQGHDSIVVWNPGEANCARLTDMAPDSYRHFVCVETACTQNPAPLKPGQHSHLQQLITF